MIGSLGIPERRVSPILAIGLAILGFVAYPNRCSAFPIRPTSKISIACRPRFKTSERAMVSGVRFPLRKSRFRSASSLYIWIARS